MSRNEKSCAFLHPDLGLGGAERLVVDAAVELASNGYQVDVYTAFHDPSRCFKETVDGPFTVKVCGGWFPRAIWGKGHAFCAYFRCILVALHIAWAAYRRKRQYDVIFADQVSAVVPFLHWFTSSKVLFYCHHPDLLLALRRPGLHRAYRAPLDWVEQLTTGQADRILINSAYTAEVFEETFSRLHERGIRPRVLHPACHIPSEEDLASVGKTWREGLPPEVVAFMQSGPTFLSINRFERKKAVELAVRAFGEVVEGRQPRGGAPLAGCRLVIAGGYDSRLAENREYLQELKALAESLGLSDKVCFLPSFSDRQRSALLAACAALLYTPTNEHFGIVPLEAMASGRPVIACNSGGPRETILSGCTGFLCESTPQSFAAAMRRILSDTGEAAKMGVDARKHVQKEFSRPAFGRKLVQSMEQMLSS